MSDSNDLANEDGAEGDDAAIEEENTGTEQVSSRRPSKTLAVAPAIPFRASERPNLIPIDEEANEFFFGADAGDSIDTSRSPDEPSDLSQHLPGAYRVGHNLLVMEDDTTLGSAENSVSPSSVAAPEQGSALPAELVTQAPLVSAAPVPPVSEPEPEPPAETNCWARRRNRYLITAAFVALIIGCLVLALIAAMQPSVFRRGDQSSPAPSEQPSASPAPSQSFAPTISPSHLPSGQPTASPSTPQPTHTMQPSLGPSTTPPPMIPTQFASFSPTTTVSPSLSPSNSLQPSTAPTDSPAPTSSPSAFPTITPAPTATPTTSLRPTAVPTNSLAPTSSPSAFPTVTPVPTATIAPTDYPTDSPAPTSSPTAFPTITPIPTATPTTGAPSTSLRRQTRRAGK